MASVQVKFQKALAAHQLGRLQEAEIAYQEILKKAPNHFDTLNLLGVLYGQHGQHSQAMELLRRAVKINPRHAEAYSNLGNVQFEIGMFQDALSSFDRALNLMPRYPNALCNRGNALKSMRRYDDALASYNRALSFAPNHLAALINRGNLLQDMGQDQDALANYEAALTIQPNAANVLCNYSHLQHRLGNIPAALQAAIRALAIEESLNTKSTFFAVVKGLAIEYDDKNDIIPLIMRAMSEPWGPPHNLVPTIITAIRQTPSIKRCIERSTIAWPSKLTLENLFADGDLLDVVENKPLLCLLESAPACSIELEKFLTLARFALLQHSLISDSSGPSYPDLLNFYCALAKQCFLNEYVFYCDETELESARKLKTRLESILMSGTPIHPLWIAAVATYFPLNSLSGINKLLDLSWASPIRSLLQQQLEEPIQEAAYADHITRLTEVNDHVSQLVRQQYEENPYPRWVKYAPQRAKTTVHTYLNETFPWLMNNFANSNKTVDYLIAGCGTGHQAIDIAQSFHVSKLVAIDLSVKSLSYAIRKTTELSITNIQYAQADIMELASTGWNFDVIESVGVLHHMSSPIAGWRVLLSMLRPNGFMKLGFYSDLARKNMSTHQSANAKDIRELRHELMSESNATQFADIFGTRDFFGTSECRDLLFHVQEHRINLIQLKEMLSELNLQLLGFQLPPQIIRQYSQRFPEDTLRNNLELWNIFEQENPRTFIGMYQFWVQKPA